MTGRLCWNAREEVYCVVGLCRSSPNNARVSGVQVDREPPKNEKTFKINS